RADVLDRALLLAVLRAGRSGHAAVRLDRAEPAAARRTDPARRVWWAVAHPAHRELSLCAGFACGAARLHGALLGLPPRLLVLRRAADRDALCRRRDRRRARPVRDLARPPA